MKRIINGVTYNTDTATKIAVWRWNVIDSEQNSGSETLYQTRGGAFFFLRSTVYWEWDGVRWAKDAEAHEFTPATREDAQRWAMTGEIELLNDALDEPPEAFAEEKPGATIYIRVPASLKAQIDDLAKNAGLSVNSWAIRCLENCAKASCQSGDVKIQK